MSRERKTIGGCPKCQSAGLTCTYNHFDKEGLTIDSWEHKCPNCGFRDTTAFRSDEADQYADDVDPTICPYCQRTPEIAS